jgi:prepilin-type N-terminal cleavage/methylation domain-containing protein
MPKLFLGLRARGFTIVELLIVIVVVGILATLGIVAYNGVTNRARDNAVLSDAEAVATEVTFYGVNNDGEYGSAVEWFSEGSPNANINFTPSDGNYIDVVASTTAYCIRVFNPASLTYKTLALAATKESSSGACGSLAASAAAIAADAAQNPADTAIVSHSSTTACALGVNSQVYCWGFGNSGLNGDGLNTYSGIPVKTTPLTGQTFVSIDLRFGRACGITSIGKAYCWGYNGNGVIGNNSTSNALSPSAVDMTGVLSGKTVESIHIGRSHTCAVASDNQAYCWGRNNYRQLGNNTTSANSLVPSAVYKDGVLSGKTIKNMYLNDDHTCVVASDDLAYCWGYNNNGQLGNNSTTNSQVPVAVDMSGVLAGKTIKSMSLGYEYTCAIASDDRIYCWGDNYYRQLGNGNTTDSSVPVAVDWTGVLSGKTVKSYSNIGDPGCAIASDDRVYCWGDNSDGQLGNGNTTDSSVPVAVDWTGVLSGKTARTFKNGPAGTACIIASDDRLYCWGNNEYGMLGNNTLNVSPYQSEVPVAVTWTGVLSGKAAKDFTVGGENVCLVTTDNHFYCWGYEDQLGNGSSSDSGVPVEVNAFPL